MLLARNVRRELGSVASSSRRVSSHLVEAAIRTARIEQRAGRPEEQNSIIRELSLKLVLTNTQSPNPRARGMSCVPHRDYYFSSLDSSDRKRILR